MPIAFAVKLGAGAFRTALVARGLRWIAQLFTSGGAPTPGNLGIASQLPGVVHPRDHTEAHLLHDVERHEQVFEAQLREVAALDGDGGGVVQSGTHQR
jgi:hypothetical protein